jgi:lipoprotein NlpD
VRRGDNLSTVAFRHGLDWRDIAAAEQQAPYIIYPDQELRLTDNIQAQSPVAGNQFCGRVFAVQVTARRCRDRRPQRRNAAVFDHDHRHFGGRGTRGPTSAPSRRNRPPAQVQVFRWQVPVAAAPAAGTVAVVGTQTPSGSAYVTPAGDPSRWLWPTEGRLIGRFQANDPARKGIDIGGKVGQPIVATANGQVVYSGNGLLGYGELIIIKHSDRMLSAYAHNSKRLVSEGQQVTAGNQIAEMGTNDRNQAELHFEIRANGSPQDPLKYLPQR